MIYVNGAQIITTCGVCNYSLEARIDEDNVIYVSPCRNCYNEEIENFKKEITNLTWEMKEDK